MRSPKRFKPSLSTSSDLCEPRFYFSPWSLFGFIVMLILASFLVPDAVERSLSTEVIQSQNQYHDQTCDELHQKTYNIRRVLDRYESTEDSSEKELIWIHANRLNAERNQTIETYRSALRRQVTAGNPQVHDLDKVCRFSVIYLESTSLVARP